MKARDGHSFSSKTAGKLQRHHQAHLRDGRCRFVFGQGPDRRVWATC
jgi:hypothetical protein